jgi:hypothetical protein
LVADAGTSEANGQYCYDRIVSNRPVYGKGTKEGGEYQYEIAYLGPSQAWLIYRNFPSTEVYYYVHSTATEPPLTGWQVWSGSAPAPTLEASQCPTPTPSPTPTVPGTGTGTPTPTQAGTATGTPTPTPTVAGTGTGTPTPTPTAASGYYTVAGAGTAGVDGQYSEAGTYITKPYYSNGTFLLFYTAGANWWGFSTTLGGALYYRTAPFTALPEGQTFVVETEGTAPAPTVTLN